MKKILVTGSDGFLASRFINYYKHTFSITAINRKALDLTNEYAVLNYFEHHQFDYVFHFAALSDTGYCEQHPQLAHITNTLVPTYIAKACALQGATLIFASSDQIFNGNTQGPYTEETLPLPNSVYAHSKLNAENNIINILPHYYNLRLPWLFSLNERFLKTNANLLTNIQKSFMTNHPITLTRNEYRSLTYVYDVIEQLEPLLNKPYGNYNFGSENNDSTFDIACFIFEALGLTHRIPDLLINDLERFKHQPRDLRISNARLQSMGIHFPTTKEGIIKCLQDFKIII